MVCLLAACEAASAPAAAPNPAHQPPATRWIHRTWFGPAVINNAPSITLCPNGSYQRTGVFQVAPGPHSGMSVDHLGNVCCRESEHGTYELTRDPRTQAITEVRFTSSDGKRSTDALVGDSLDGFMLGPRAFDCLY